MSSDCLIAVIAATTDDIDVPLWPWGLLIIAAGLYVVAVAAMIAAGRREDARALAGFVPDCAILIGRLARDRRVPRRRRVLLWSLVAYLATPIDLVPDFLPVAGQLDDAVLVGIALRVLVRGGGETLVREAWPGPETSLTLVLRAAGLQANGRTSPDRPSGEPRRGL
jgi:uncharacterized membrane protein YkvA (DUF1232 family)